MTDRQKQHLKNLDRTVVWHPFTQMQDYAQAEPIIITRGDGVYLEDMDGNRYLDGFASMWCNVHGHQVPEIDNAIRNQLDQVAHSTLLGLPRSHHQISPVYFIQTVVRPLLKLQSKWPFNIGNNVPILA
jgi:adenosylmethionine-8-amino-7-oxononanoate aminotransferase